MPFVLATVFGAFWVWRVIGARLTARGRGQNAAGYQVFGVMTFLMGVWVGTYLATGGIAPEGSGPLVVLAVVTAVPFLCGLVAVAPVLACVFLLPAVAPRVRPPASNPFGEGG
jgi:hypothetical protein